MTDANAALDIKLQIGFGVFVILGLIVALAGVHSRDSLGAIWYHTIRHWLCESVRSSEPGTLSLNESDEEASIGLIRRNSIQIPSFRISFDEDLL